MENEQLKFFDEYRNQMGVATREEVHRLGYWHEAFHCWLSAKNKEYIIFTYSFVAKIKKIILSFRYHCCWTFTGYWRMKQFKMV
ncbi:hypothetical protein AB1K84_20100 [Mesobacillus foraminis]|uniref:hypothetical protein n=1 Tax=Mesobacillus foraminis TaxID=279826 RepID=UPI00399FBB2D